MGLRAAHTAELAEAWDASPAAQRVADLAEGGDGKVFTPPPARGVLSSALAVCGRDCVTPAWAQLLSLFKVRSVAQAPARPALYRRKYSL